MKKAIKVLIIIASSLVLLCIIIYAAGLVVFNKMIMPNTSFYAEDTQTDISWFKKDQLENITEGLAHKTLTINVTDDVQRTISLSDEVDYMPNRAFQSLVLDEIIGGQEGWLTWPKSIFEEKSIYYEPLYVYDSDKLKELASSMDLGYEEAPEDAYITLTDNNEIVIIEEVDGNTIDRGDLFECLNEHVAEDDLTVYPDEIKYIMPEVKADDESLVEAKNAYDSVTDRIIYVNMVGVKDELRLGTMIDMYDLFYNWNITLIEDKLDQYVDYLQSKYNTYETQRDFKTHDGKMIKVGGNGDQEYDTYGFTLEWDDTYNAIYDAIYDFDISEVDAVWDREAPYRDEINDIGKTYIEISLTEQHLWYWIDGKLFLETPVVTGLPTPSRSTLPGVYGIFSKGEGINLKGEMDGEKWDSFVNYWMSVTYSEVGIHDAPWRGNDPANYGGDIYTYNGSHGCINLPYDAEKKLYENTPMGTCVVIY